MQRANEINESELKRIMQAAEIQSVSIASGTDIDNIICQNISNNKDSNSNEKTKEPVFGVASLSKPVFAYLVLKLINDEDFKINTQLNKILPFNEFCEKHNIIWDNSPENIDRTNQFTPDMLLSHRSGLPIGYNPESGPLKFDFEPNQGFAYSGFNLKYLQDCIEIKFGKKLEELAKEFVFIPAHMSKDSTFNTPVADAANSLRTTATDYARFCIHWMQDPDPLVQQAFTSKVSLRNDPWAVRENISPDTLNHLAWGYGWGLEENDSGKLIAFHTGDMGEWRAGVQLDLHAKSVKVFLSKSSFENGHLLQDKIFGESHALSYFFDKFKFARKLSELRDDWREKPSWGLRKESIQHTYEPTSSTASILATVSSYPLEMSQAKSQDNEKTLNEGGLETTLAQPQLSSANNDDKDNNKTYESPKPTSTKLKPPGGGK